MSTFLHATVLSVSLLALPGRGRADIWEFVDADGVRNYATEPQGPGWTKKVASSPTGRARSAGMKRAPRDPSDARFTRFDDHIRAAAHLYRLPEALIRAVILVESDYDPAVVSVDGAMGLMQLMPRTAELMGVTDPHDPRQNIFGGTRFLRILANQFNGDLLLTLAAYNAGGGAVTRYGGVPPFPETHRYVNRVHAHYRTFQARAR